MPRQEGRPHASRSRITGALRSHGTALALAGAAAAVVMCAAGTADAATTTPHPATATRPDTFSLGTSAATLTGSGAGVTLTGAVPAQVSPAHQTPAASPVPPTRRLRQPARWQSLPAHASAPHAVPVRRPVQLAARRHHTTHQARPEHAAAPARPYEIYDSVTPASIPPHEQVAVYATGSYAASPSSVARDRQVLWIDTQGSDPRASALDVEPGDATPTDAASWARAKLSADPNSPAIIYTMRSEGPPPAPRSRRCPRTCARRSAGGSRTRRDDRISCLVPTPRSGTGKELRHLQRQPRLLTAGAAPPSPRRRGSLLSGGGLLAAPSGRGRAGDGC